MTTTVQLKKPIEAHGELKSELTFSEMVAGDIMECGYPFRQDSKNGGGIDAAVVGKLIGRLAKIPDSSVKSLCVQDFNACLEVVLGFFN